ncbi:hypothetical protein Airi02_102610 [Actinoallomurus iriomotensis]|uniref:Uncharacterized protein n=1 Tax=Actinoallomurus iriomotensis TaxID=478107 RepID=A0A9W6W0H9_9ACTN|nr:hypothetical protein Airi02_102610 [Actinoallomurus iriomotensis]
MREYVSGLVAGLERKNGWTLAEHAGAVSPDGMQRLLRRADWDIDGVRDDVRDYVVEHLGDREGVLIVDEQTEIPLDAAVVFGVSDSALHVWAADPMLNRVGEHLGQIPLERIASIKVEGGKSWQPVTISMADGKSVELEGRGSIHAVAAEFDKRKAG